MQASQDLETAEGFKDTSKASSVRESTKQGPKKRSTRAERAERKRTEAKSAKAVKRLERRRAKTIDSAKRAVAEVVTPTQPPKAEESPTSISAYARKTQKISEAAGKEANETDSAGDVSGKQRPIALKLDDIMDLLESSKKHKTLVKRTRGIETGSTISKETTRSFDQSEVKISHLI